jgi:dTDP-4-amino-4,6-dideoxygalactose transaminase
MNVTYADLNREYREAKASIDDAISEVIRNSWFINGPKVAEFEILWAEYTNEPAAVGVSSGTSALMLALASLDVGPGDEVIVPAMSFISTAEVASQLGATPVFVDTDQYNTIDISQVADAITPRTRAIIFVDLYGQTIDIPALHRVARGIPIIRDAAQSAGARMMPYFPDPREHTYLHATCWSFYPGKNLSAMGDAGAVTGDQHVCQRIRKLRDHGRREKYVHEEVGWNERLDGMQAAILCAKLPYLEKWNAQRQVHAAIYRETLLDAPVQLPRENPASTHVYNQFVIEVEDRDRVRRAMLDAGIEVGIQFPLAMHQQPVYQHLGYRLPASERLAVRCMSLPVHAHLDPEQVHYASAALLDIISG